MSGRGAKLRVDELCPHCGQELPRAPSYLTDREMDLLVAWWMEGTITAAASRLGMGQQRAKNLIRQARIRNHVKSNRALLSLHFAAVRSCVSEKVSQNTGGSAVA